MTHPTSVINEPTCFKNSSVEWKQFVEDLAIDWVQCKVYIYTVHTFGYYVSNYVFRNTGVLLGLEMVVSAQMVQHDE